MNICPCLLGIVGQIPADTAQGNFYLSVQIRIAEPGRVSTQRVVAVLSEFASLANLIISLFDT
jgi:hypothetical protein